MKYLIFLILCILFIISIIRSVPIINEIETSNYIEIIRKEFNNNNIIGYLKINELESPIVKGNDNTYYLNHNINNEYDIKGSIFQDYRTNFEDKISIIYGHSSDNIEVPFNYLSNYYDEYFYYHNNIINIYTSKDITKYQIFSIFIEYQDWFYLDLNYNYNDYLKKMSDKSWYKSSIDVSKEDNILVIQTCSFHKDYTKYPKKYLIIAAKKIKN